MSKIALLPDFVIDQIAAGEVLENPASAVKELIENSIDAGATEIRIEIEGGGLQRIFIEDDGCGMNREDAILCLRRHATSKIRSAEDLERLRTMGFRGEALAALASVSKLELKTSDGTEATRIADRIESTARNRGTTVDAKSLFYNAPARLKFQKAASSCAAAILKVVQTISLSHSEIHFRLFSNGKMTFNADAKDWRARAEEILGSFAHEVKGIRGLLGRPEEAKLNRSGQIVFVNRRPIFSPLIAKAVKEGYGTRMAESLFPVFILFLEVSSDSVDVNVHPQKREVRFREEGKVFAQVRDAVAASFQKQPFQPLPWEFTSVPYVAMQPTFVLEDAPMPLPMEIPASPKAVLGGFLLLEWKCVDLKGAEARILFEEMKKHKPAMQPLLIPLQVTGDEELVGELQILGFEARVVGKRQVAIDAVPVGMERAEEFVRLFSAERKLAAALTRTIRARTKKYTFEEACLIWRRLQLCQDPGYDPLGRKVVIEMSEKELSEMFG